MKKLLPWLGWIGGIGALTAALWLFTLAETRKAETEQLRATVGEMCDQLAQLKTELEEKSNALADAQQQLAAQGNGPPPSGVNGSTSDSLLGKLAASLFKGGRASPTTSSADESNSTNPFLSAFSDLFKGEGGKQFASMAAEMSVGQLYAGLLRDLHLSPEREQQVREILVRHAREESEAAFKLFDQDFSLEKLMKGEAKLDPELLKKSETLSKQPDAGKASLRNELSGLLTAEELAQYDDYEEHIMERVQEEQFNVQLQTFAAGLTPDNQTRAVQVLVEESPLSKEDLRTVPDFSKGPPQEFFQRQLEGVRKARERLAQEFDPDQLAAFDRFVTQQEQQAAFLERIMGPMFNQLFPSEETKPQAAP